MTFLKIIDVKLYKKSRMHAKLYLFLTNPEERYTSSGLAVVDSSNFTAEGLTKNKELNVLLTSKGGWWKKNADKWSCQ